MRDLITGQPPGGSEPAVSPPSAAPRARRAGLIEAGTAALTRALGRRGRLQGLGLLAGAGLLVAAIVLLWQQHASVDVALASIRSLPRSRLVGLGLFLFGSTLTGIVLSGMMFSVLVRRYGQVGVLEMQALIAAATLVNHLPTRPGSVGRVAYHRVVNAIAIRHSVRIVVQGLALSAATAVYCTAAALASLKLRVPISLLLAAPLPLMLVGLVGGDSRGRFLLAALPRYGEALLLAARYYVVFSMIGTPIEAPHAIALASVSMLASVVPVLGSGLGLRTWAVGLLAPTLAGVSLEVGLIADLIGQAAELVIAIPAGSLGVAYLIRRQRRLGRAASPAPVRHS